MSSVQATRFAIQRARRRSQVLGAITLLLLSVAASPSLAQGLQPGEAFATRFSGSVQGPDGAPAIDLQGTVGSILDLRAPGRPPQGQHWVDEPQRAPITAAQTGQVFGVAFDEAAPPNIYVTATAAFGLHRTADNKQWMPGMFGGGGPGAIYKLDAANGYQPQLFSVIRLNGRDNTGAALGNITYDRWNRQFLVSDLETGMIHRISLDGLDLGSYDHGVQGRAGFLDAQTGQQQSLAAIAFDPASQVRVADCEGRFDNKPECWNVAQSGRRVWGLGVWRGPNGGTRLYYSVASSPDLGGSDWNSLPEEEKRNTLWSVRLGPDGSFDVSDVRREFALPDFFSNPNDIARAGYSRPVSDITFPACSGRAVMLAAERGGLRNLGLGQENAFATPHESRTIRYELDQSGTWRVMGRYDVGMYDRSNEGPPYINANCAGGVTFGPGYSPDGVANGPADQFVWISGDKLCSPEGPCNAQVDQAHVQQAEKVQPVSAQGDGSSPYQPDDTEVHGAQGQPEQMYNALVPEPATTETPQEVNPIGPGQAYMVDFDINVDATGQAISFQAPKNDATMIGDISVYQICPLASAGYVSSYPLMAVPVGVIHGRGVSHYRAGSHARFFSHWRWHSHTRWASHDRRWSVGHHRGCSEGHWRRLSRWHRRGPSFPWHCRGISHHRRLSHVRHGSHWLRLSHVRYGSHAVILSHLRHGSHELFFSHRRHRSHSVFLSHRRHGSHTVLFSHRRHGSHSVLLSHVRHGSHAQLLSHQRTGSSHLLSLSHQRIGSSHLQVLSHQRTGSSHVLSLSHQRIGSGHLQALSHQRIGSSHAQLLSHQRKGSNHSSATSQGTPVPRARTPQGGQHLVALSRKKVQVQVQRRPNRVPQASGGSNRVGPQNFRRR